jgi:dolichol-phosphate mannosyltransferase
MPGFSVAGLRRGGLESVRVIAMAVVAITLALRLLYCFEVELMPEEAYYWNYSRHLDFGYLDHPPMTAWLIRLGTAVFGATEFGVRAGALLCGGITAYFSFRLTRNIFGEAAALSALVLTQALPYFFLSGVLMTPDAPLCAAWAASLYFLERALIGGRAGAWVWAGLCLGLGMISKYTIGLLGCSAALFCLLDPPSRGWLRRGAPYAAALIALAIFSPVLIWNAQHDWASFTFQTARRLAEAPRFALHKLIASAMVLITPTGVVAAAAALWRPGTTAETRRASRLLQLAVLTPLAVFAAFSLRHEVKLDWTGAPWVAALPLMALTMVRRQSPRAWISAAWAPTILAMGLAYSAGLYYLVLGIPGAGYGQHAELVPVGWRDLGRQVHALSGEYQRRTGMEPLIVGMDRYAIASELAFYAPDQSKSILQTASSNLFGNVGLMYEFWFPKQRQRGRALLLVAWDRQSLEESGVESGVETLQPVMSGTLSRNGDPIRPFYYRFGAGYRASSP